MEASTPRDYLVRLEEQYRSGKITDYTWGSIANITCLAFLVWKGIRGAALSDYPNLSDEVKEIAPSVVALFPGVFSRVQGDDVIIFRDPLIEKFLLERRNDDITVLILGKMLGYLQPSTTEQRTSGKMNVFIEWNARIGKSVFSLYNEVVSRDLPPSMIENQLKTLKTLNEIGVTVFATKFESFQ